MGLARKFFRKKRRRGKPAPRWLQVLLIIFILYGVATGLPKGTPQAPNPVHDNMMKVAEELDPRKFPLEEYKNVLFPAYTASLDIKDVTTGDGPQAVCGQEVKIAYSATLLDGRDIADKADADAPLVFRIGEGEVIPALEQGTAGMRPGGQRSLVATLNMSYGIEKFARPDEHFAPNARIRYTVDLLSASPALPDIAANPFRVATIYVRDGGSPVLCGQEVKAHVTLWGVDGKKLFSTKDAGGAPITFTPGKSQVFMGLEQGILGITRGGARTLIVPPAFQKTLQGNAPAIHFPLPKAQTVLVDVEALP